MLGIKVGHYGIFNGKRWRDEIMPVVRNWIRSHDKGHSEVPKVDLVPVTHARAA